MTATKDYIDSREFCEYKLSRSQKIILPL